MSGLVSSHHKRYTGPLGWLIVFMMLRENQNRSQINYLHLRHYVYNAVYRFQADCPRLNIVDVNWLVCGWKVLIVFHHAVTAAWPAPTHGHRQCARSHFSCLSSCSLLGAFLHVKSSPPSAIYMRQWIGSALVQIMALSPIRLLLIGPLGTNFSEILIKIQNFSFTNVHVKISAIWSRGELI